MPKRTDISSILIIGAGPIVIGQACEFDYSGTQACKALREEGYRIILVNSNPATIMTDPDLADATYIEPITPELVAKIIEKERPDALLPTMGGQTALNCALDLEQMGVLEKYGVEMIAPAPMSSKRLKTAKSSGLRWTSSAWKTRARPLPPPRQFTTRTAGSSVTTAMQAILKPCAPSMRSACRRSSARLHPGWHRRRRCL